MRKTERAIRDALAGASDICRAANVRFFVSRVTHLDGHRHGCQCTLNLSLHFSDQFGSLSSIRSIVSFIRSSSRVTPR